MELKERERGQYTTAVIDSAVWKAIWDMKVPNSVKLFTWRACQNILLTRVNLSQRKVVDDCSCPCCGSEEETTIHAVWSCPAAQDVWGEKFSCFQKCNTHLSSFVHLLEYSLQRFSKDQVELLAVVARKVWLRRNSLVFEGVFRHPKEVLEEAFLSLEDFRKWNSLEESNVMQSGSVSFSRMDRWSPPPHGRVKVNWDASINFKKKCIGVDIVIFEGDAAQVISDINSPPHFSKAGHITESVSLELKSF
jgi:hypothetical protein